MWICVIALFLLNPFFFHICKMQSLTGLIPKVHIMPSISVGSKLTYNSSASDPLPPSNTSSSPSPMPPILISTVFPYNANGFVFLSVPLSKAFIALLSSLKKPRLDLAVSCSCTAVRIGDLCNATNIICQR